MQLYSSLNIFVIALLWGWMKTDLFQSCGQCWVFQICCHIECSTVTASSFRTWNRSTRIPSLPLALLVLMISKVHFTSHSRMSECKWVTTPSLVIQAIKTFCVQIFCVFFHIFLISSASVRSLPFLSFIVSSLAWNVPLVSPIILKRSLVFLFYCFPLLLCIFHLSMPSYLSWLFFGTLHSLGYNFTFLTWISRVLFPQLFVKPPQTPTLLPCFYFSFGWFLSLSPVQCYEPLSIVLQADLNPLICSSPLLYNHKGFYLGHTWIA